MYLILVKAGTRYLASLVQRLGKHLLIQWLITWLTVFMASSF